MSKAIGLITSRWGKGMGYVERDSLRQKGHVRAQEHNKQADDYISVVIASK